MTLPTIDTQSCKFERDLFDTGYFIINNYIKNETFNCQSYIS